MSEKETEPLLKELPLTKRMRFWLDVLLDWFSIGNGYDWHSTVIDQKSIHGLSLADEDDWSGVLDQDTSDFKEEENSARMALVDFIYSPDFLKDRELFEQKLGEWEKELVKRAVKSSS